MGVKVQLDQMARQMAPSNSSGLILGTAAHQVRILYFLPTPTSPPGTSPHRWAVEHAKLIRPMCPGGLSILGTYLPLRGTSASPSKDLQAAAAIARDIVERDDNIQNPLVLCRGPKGRVIVKQVAPNPDDLPKTGDLKELPELAKKVIPIRATLSISQTLFPIKSNFATPGEFRYACSSIANALACQTILQLPDELNSVITDIEDSRSLSEIMGWTAVLKDEQKKPVFSEEPIEVRLLTPVSVDCEHVDNSTVNPSEDGSSFTSLHGSVHLEGIATEDSSTGNVLQALRADLVRSLRTRADLLVESYLPDADDGDNSQMQWDQPDCSSFPARVVASPVSAALRFLSLTEYLMPEEGVDEDVKSRFLEAFSWDEEKLEEFSLEQKEEHNPTPTESGAVFSSTSLTQDGAPLPNPSTTNAFDTQSVMRTSLVLAFILGLLAIVIKQLIDLR